MNTKLLIAENNEKRKLLDDNNKKIYEDMLMYIRLSYGKSQQESEEILMELLDHLLHLQQEGKATSELFGKDPKQYADQIIEELPKTLTKKRMMLILMGLFYFLGVSTFINGFFHSILYYGFGKLEGSETYYLGTLAIISLVSIGIAFVVVYFVIQYLKWMCFRKVNKVLDFLRTAVLFGVIPFSAFLALFYFMPDMGTTITLPVYSLMIIGVIFFGLGTLLLKES
ncbi:DUF1129 domain-containing protein [Gracilibacillus caseinilyticus]|uniref:DUF1129 domain-containing protein n=1 Tax=Gracilibacillus caseinilyticus TaxID=2932256 RepID=A0ABY4EY58_9BACI|nr:DUF1129 family protein [Gracilibacillus caseinilyticus]UOQ49344.1 DUF1129 domain-containing protein [Gracilibacillus caseinilyticus]